MRWCISLAILLRWEQRLCHTGNLLKYNLIDFELGVKIAGAGFPVYLGKGARLQKGISAVFLIKIPMQVT